MVDERGDVEITLSAVATAAETVSRHLELIGWEVREITLDLHRKTARVEIKRFDGRLVTLDARNGRASITREEVYTHKITIGRPGDRCIVERIGTRFLGRQSYTGVRAAFKGLAHYVADNSSVDRIEAKNIFRPLLEAATPKVDR